MAKNRFDLGGGKRLNLRLVYDPQTWNKVAPLFDAVPEICAAAVYGEPETAESFVESKLPVRRHLSGPGQSIRKPSMVAWFYPSAKSSGFANPASKDFDYSAEAVSHSRTLSFLKPLIGGPFFDIEDIWEEHTYYEFADPVRGAHHVDNGPRALCQPRANSELHLGL